MQGYRNPGRHIAGATKFSVVVTNICGAQFETRSMSPTWAIQLLKWPHDFWKIVDPWPNVTI